MPRLPGFVDERFLAHRLRLFRERRQWMRGIHADARQCAEESPMMRELLEVRIDDLTIDFGARAVRRGADELVMRPKEFDLLAALVRHRGRVVSRAELLREVWGYAAGTESRTVETHLAALRERLGDDPQNPRYIVTVRRAGYRLGQPR